MIWPDLERYLKLTPVLRTRDVCPGYEFFHPGSTVKKIPDPGSGSASKNRSILDPKKWFLSSRKYNPGCCSSWIRILNFYPSRNPDPGVKKAPDPVDPQQGLPQSKQDSQLFRAYSYTCTQIRIGIKAGPGPQLLLFFSQPPLLQLLHPSLYNSVHQRWAVPQISCANRKSATKVYIRGGQSAN